jgi:hypothetical protein
VKKLLPLFFMVLILQSCVVHSNFPFICFAKKCRQDKSSSRHLAAKIKRNRMPKLKGTIVSGKALPKKKKTKPNDKKQATDSHPSFSN